MSRAFSIARAVDAAHTAMIVGKINADGTTVYGKPYDKQDARETYCSLIDPLTLTWNTGFVDCEGKEIFLGDYLSIPYEYSEPYLIIFNEDEGAFYTVRSSSKTEKKRVSNCATSFICHFSTESYYDRITRDVAVECRIVGNIFEKLLGGKTDE